MEIESNPEILYFTKQIKNSEIHLNSNKKITLKYLLKIISLLRYKQLSRSFESCKSFTRKLFLTSLRLEKILLHLLKKPLNSTLGKLLDRDTLDRKNKTLSSISKKAGMIVIQKYINRQLRSQLMNWKNYQPYQYEIIDYNELNQETALLKLKFLLSKKAYKETIKLHQRALCKIYLNRLKTNIKFQKIRAFNRLKNLTDVLFCQTTVEVVKNITVIEKYVKIDQNTSDEILLSQRCKLVVEKEDGQGNQIGTAGVQYEKYEEFTNSSSSNDPLSENLIPKTPSIKASLSIDKSIPRISIPKTLKTRLSRLVKVIPAGLLLAMLLFLINKRLSFR